MNKREEYLKIYGQRPDVIARLKEYRKEYYKRPDVIAKKKKYRQRPEMKKWLARYYKLPESKKSHNRAMNKYLKSRRKKDLIFKLKQICRGRIYIFLRQNGYDKKVKTFDMIGCTPEELKLHIGNQFTNGMSFNKLGREIHIDHIIPLVSANTEEEVLKLCHYTNLQPLWARDNLTKGIKY